MYLRIISASSPPSSEARFQENAEMRRYCLALGMCVRAIYTYRARIRTCHAHEFAHMSEAPTRTISASPHQIVKTYTSKGVYPCGDESAHLRNPHQIVNLSPQPASTGGLA